MKRKKGRAIPVQRRAGSAALPGTGAGLWGRGRKIWWGLWES